MVPLQLQKVVKPAAILGLRSFNLTSEPQSKVEISRCSFAVGIDHRQETRSAENLIGRVRAIFSFNVGALAGFHGVCRGIEAEVKIL